jgi:CSLREA domain-containing protein
MSISTPIRGSAATLAIATTLGALVPAAAAQPAAASLPATKTADTNDGACDSDCSVREAVIAANSSPGMDTIKAVIGCP